MKTLFTSLIVLLSLLNVRAQDEVKQITLTEDPDFESNMYNYYSGEVLLELPSQGVVAFDINTGAGEVEITPSSLPVITVEAKVIIMTGNEKKANKFLSEDLELSLERKGDQANLISSFDYSNNEKGNDVDNPFDFLRSPDRKINLKIKVPNHISLDIDDNSGDLILANLVNDVDIYDGSGLVYLNNIDGNIMIDDASGDLVLKNINRQSPEMHQLKIRDNSGEIRLENIRGEAKLNDASGDIRVKDHVGNLVLNDASGDIRLTNIEGDLTVDDASGDIISRTVAGNIEVYDSSGDIYIRDVLLNVNIRDAGAGNLTLEDVKGKITGDISKLDRLN